MSISLLRVCPHAHPISKRLVTSPEYFIIKSGCIFGNDAVAVIQSVFPTIKDKKMLNNIFKILNRTVEDYIDDVGDKIYNKNYHKHKVPTVRQSLQRLGYEIDLDNIGYVYGGGALG